MNYYQKKQFVAEVNKDDGFVGKIEKWETHKQGLLHRGFTVIILYNGKYILQHRKHPAFNKTYDLSFSSHPIYENGKLQIDSVAILSALKREWNIEKKDLKSGPIFLGKIYYKAKDPKSEFTEHEIDYIYEVELNKLPSPNLNFAYGFKLINKLEIKNLKINLAPWVKVMLEQKLI